MQRTKRFRGQIQTVRYLPTCPTCPPAMPPKQPSTSRCKSTAELARPHKYMFGAQAHALVCLLRTDKALAKYWCPTLVERGESTVDGNTNADDLLVALFQRCGGELERTRKKAPEGAAKNVQGAAPFRIKKRAGRPNTETAVTDAAVKLVTHRGEARVQRDAAKARRCSSSAPPRLRRATALKPGNFSARGNAIVPVKRCAVVEVSQFSSWLVTSCRCRCGQPLIFNDKGSVQARRRLARPTPALPASRVTFACPGRVRWAARPYGTSSARAAVARTWRRSRPARRCTTTTSRSTTRSISARSRALCRSSG